MERLKINKREFFNKEKYKDILDNKLKEIKFQKEGKKLTEIWKF